MKKQKPIIIPRDRIFFLADKLDKLLPSEQNKPKPKPKK